MTRTLASLGNRIKKLFGKLHLAYLMWTTLGANWVIFRFTYALKLGSGWMARRHAPYLWQNRPLESWLRSDVPSNPDDYAQWREQHGGKFIFDRLPDVSNDTSEAEAVLRGTWRYFGYDNRQIGVLPNWHKNALTGSMLAHDRHWSQIPEFGADDIKWVWEANRFSAVFPLLRAYATSKDETYSAGFWALVEHWAASNPPQLGPNWKCGQETSLRLMAWCFGLYGFRDSVHTTPQRIAQLTTYIAAQAERIEANIDYAHFTRSNHGISEGMGLWLVGVLFPELKRASIWQQMGRETLEQEIHRQVYDDGTYSMHSFNYHRSILQTYYFALRLGEVNGVPFSRDVYQLIEKSVQFLYQVIDLNSGYVPLYGSNDGSLLIPLNNCEFNDMRPTLQLGAYLTSGTTLFPPGSWDEDLLWFYGVRSAQPTAPQQISQAFPIGGYYTLRTEKSWIMVHCSHYQSRPSHADQLIVDLWWRGLNIVCDAGTYSYNSPAPWSNGLAQTGAHNTVTVDHQEQMRQVTRFTWLDWAQGVTSFYDGQRFEGSHTGYEGLPDSVKYRRTVQKIDEVSWLVIDHLTAKMPHDYRLHWLLPDFSYTQDGNEVCLNTPQGQYAVVMACDVDGASLSLSRAAENSVRGWRSLHYGQRIPALSIEFAALRANSVTFKTLFTAHPEASQRLKDLGLDANQTSRPIFEPQSANQARDSRTKIE